MDDRLTLWCVRWESKIQRSVPNAGWYFNETISGYGTYKTEGKAREIAAWRAREHPGYTITVSRIGVWDV